MMINPPTRLRTQKERFHWISLKMKLMFEANRSTNRVQDFILLVSQLGQFLSCVHIHSFSELKRRNEDLCTTTCSVKAEICRKQTSNIQKIHLSLKHADPGAKTADEPWFTQYMIGIYYFKKHTHLFNICTRVLLYIITVYTEVWPAFTDKIIFGSSLCGVESGWR